MGWKCLLVVVLFMSQSVFARDCTYILDNPSTNECDECIRCGGKWCNDASERTQCVIQNEDNWCPSKQETFEHLLEKPREKGTYFDTLYAEKRVFAGKSTVKYITVLRHPPVKSTPRAYLKIVNATQPSLSSTLDINVGFDKNTNQINVNTMFSTEFCSPNSTKYEHVYVKVGLLGVSEEVILNYQVPCACACTERVERNSSECSGLGDLSCGVCHCREDRVGARCEKKKCSDRGDNPPTCKNPSKPEMLCSGNGRCNECDECECFTDWDIEGSQYFDPDNYCEDLCSTTNKCADCLKTAEPGHCDQCDTAYVYIMNTNASALEERDGGRKLWVHCNVTVPDCGIVEYAAMQQNGEKHVMVLKACEGTTDLFVAGGKGITVPLISGLIAAAVLMAAAGVGYMVWKGRGAAPLPLTSPEYTNIDAEDCTGVNPLYKPPTSSFKNPMYGKS